MTITAYLRISTNEQDHANQWQCIESYLKRHHPDPATNELCPYSRIDDTVSSKVPWRDRAIGDLLKNAVSGDLIIVSEVSRLARSTLECLEIFQESAKKNITIHCVKDNLTMDGSMQSEIMTTILGMAAKIERHFISQRTKETMQRKIKENEALPDNEKTQIGRPKQTKTKPAKRKLDKYKHDVIKQFEQGTSIKTLCEAFKVNRATMNTFVRLHANTGTLWK